MFWYENMTYQEVNKHLNSKLVILPTGSIEQHSVHLPLSVDSIIATKLSERLAEKLDAVVAPTLKYGARSLANSGGGMIFPGTIGLSGKVLIPYYSQIIKGYVEAGAKRLLILNAHWENEAFLIEAIEEIKDRLDGEVKIVQLSWWNVISEEDMKQIFGSFASWNVEHAGQAETALILELTPSLVGTFDTKVKTVIQNPNIYTNVENVDILQNNGSLSQYSHVTKVMAKQFLELVDKRLYEMVGEVGLNEVC